DCSLPVICRGGGERFAAYEAKHRVLTTWVVGPVMLAEVFTAAWLVYDRLDTPEGRLAWIGMGLVFLIWVSTAIWSVPAHERLSTGFDARVHRRLVITSWIRTAGWTARSAVVLMIV
ncbi:MAG: hypothetical protein KDA75_21025, partial [Planctomycetaceae bacterium]|nr:hypothetical protein [Planctomycetaceae bacterium]